MIIQKKYKNISNIFQKILDKKNKCSIIYSIEIESLAGSCEPEMPAGKNAGDCMTKKTTKKDVIEVLRGMSISEIIYKNVPFKYCANNMTVKECNEYIKERLENYIG
ncbi:MAG: hypothetical protein WC389_03635 [Lutibacter sp.]